MRECLFAFLFDSIYFVAHESASSEDSARPQVDRLHAADPLACPHGAESLLLTTSHSTLKQFLSAAFDAGLETREEFDGVCAWPSIAIEW